MIIDWEEAKRQFEATPKWLKSRDMYFLWAMVMDLNKRLSAYEATDQSQKRSDGEDAGVRVD
jgi:hypothetical protein